MTQPASQKSWLFAPMTFAMDVGGFAGADAAHPIDGTAHIASHTKKAAAPVTR
jgi:hypothetical protein